MERGEEISQGVDFTARQNFGEAQGYCGNFSIEITLDELARIIREWEEIGRQKKPPLLQTC